MGSRRHLNIRGKSANLPAITERDWKDIDFGIRMGVDFYALSFVRDAACIYELQAYLKRHGSTAQVRLRCRTAASPHAWCCGAQAQRRAEAPPPGLKLATACCQPA